MTELIIAEKPDAARNIAKALADSSPKKLNIDGVPYYELTRNNKKIIVASAVGHLYTLATKKKSWNYPQFDTVWTETSKVNKNSKFTSKYVNALKKLSKQADEFTVATDYDIEGEVIGYNIIRFICNQKDANRMKFSTLTKPDIIEAYENKQKTIDWGQAKAGITRHELDWYYGINLSSALTSAIRQAGVFKVLSSGRVQGPALKLICDKEKEIMAFKPKPYWEIQLLGKVKNQQIEAWHEEDKIFDEKRADEIIRKTKNQVAVVFSKEVSEFKQMPPTPFDLTTFQIECFRVHKISPKDSLTIAQELYIEGYISYPRTSSQKLPEKIGFKNILNMLKLQSDYKTLAEKLLSKQTLKPHEGNKVDDAHPAIFPTGITPEHLNSKQKKVYDLIVRRFLATFADPAVRETVKITIEINKENFIAKGTVTKIKGWHEFYGEYAVFDEIILPDLKKGDIISDPKITKISKETQPPKRYTQASIIKELDKRNLGTKATRAQIIENLYTRGYVNEKSLEATDLGLKTCDILEKYSPTILDEKLTRKFEEELEKIRHNKMTPEQVLKEAKEVLTKILQEFKSKEKEIGLALKQAEIDSKNAKTIIGQCPNCKKGTLKIRKGKFGFFVGCDSYPECKTIFSIPQKAEVKSSNKLCEECKHPMINIKQPNKYPIDVCINPECKTRKTQEEHKAEETGNKAYPEEGMVCPSCKKGKMVIRKSYYGTFLGCNNYPKCKTMMKIENGKVNTNAITKTSLNSQNNSVNSKDINNNNQKNNNNNSEEEKNINLNKISDKDKSSKTEKIKTKKKKNIKKEN